MAWHIANTCKVINHARVDLTVYSAPWMDPGGYTDLRRLVIKEAHLATDQHGTIHLDRLTTNNCCWLNQYFTLYSLSMQSMVVVGAVAAAVVVVMVTADENL